MRRKTIKRKRRKGGDALHAHVAAIFSNFEIKRTKEFIQIQLIGCAEQQKHPKGYSPRIEIINDHMYIARLSSCAPLTGAELIHRFIELARRLEIHTIHVDDGSEIYFPRTRYGDSHCKIDLAILRILQKGQSWYESFGFVPHLTAKDREHNEHVRHMPFRDFIAWVKQVEQQEALDRVERRFQYHQNTAQRNREMKEAYGHSSILEGLSEDAPVYYAIQKMVDRVNAEGEAACESDTFKMLQKIIEICTLTDDPIIRYKIDDLTLML